MYDKQKWLDRKLLEAASKANAEDVEALLDLGADVNTKDENGRTPLIRLYFDNRFESILNYIKEHFKIKNERKKCYNLSMIMKEKSKAIDNVRSILCKNGANQTIKDNFDNSAHFYLMDWVYKSESLWDEIRSQKFKKE